MCFENHAPVLRSWDAHAHRPAAIEMELRIVRRRHGVCAIKVEQVRTATQHTLLHCAAAPETKVMQTAAQQGVGPATLHAGVKGSFYNVPGAAAGCGYCGGVPAGHR